MESDNDNAGDPIAPPTTMEVDTDDLRILFGEATPIEKPPIVQGVRNDVPLPDIPHEGTHDVHKASESACVIELFQAIEWESASVYTDEANKYIDENDFADLNGIGLGEDQADPTILIHNNESDVGRSIDYHVNRVLALMMQGSSNGKFTISSTSQDQVSTRTPLAENERIIHIPDWFAICYIKREDGSVDQVPLVTEYKYRHINPTAEIKKEWELAHDRLLRHAINQASDPNLYESLMGNLPESVRSTASDGLRGRIGQFPFLASSRLENLPAGFAKDLESVSHQTTTYGVCRGSEYVCLLDWDTLVVFRYHMMDLSLPVEERIINGPGVACKAAVVEGSEEIRRTLFGVWVKSMRERKQRG
ncbi:hypothetical protein K4K49_005298 [Colletotrichum sp. SAR 10_70]|nr:hypothetical protein KHU50_006505 [Colletotrichum sp. SAR 10_65]KAI8167463.1 hypothetical protein K4K49_005298 [Colletotrichum sp. SAR 10_70]KAI8170537.1 hypothetical protein K4K50_006171 [Colletotrichum sp. SAR 10_71]KAI8210547.1 hypothetical protein K4K52_012079 [Colletotrichum sp. SAR 10_76]